MCNVRQDANAQVTRENNATPKSKELLQPEIGTPNASDGVLLYQHSALRIMSCDRRRTMEVAPTKTSEQFSA